MPQERRERIQRQLERYQSLSPEQRQQLRRQYEWFRELPPERQAAARRLAQQFAQLPVERRRELRQEVQRLRRMDDAGRARRLDSEAFRSQYSPEERQMLRELAEFSPGG